MTPQSVDQCFAQLISDLTARKKILSDAEFRMFIFALKLKQKYLYDDYFKIPKTLDASDLNYVDHYGRTPESRAVINLINRDEGYMARDILLNRMSKSEVLNAQIELKQWIRMMQSNDFAVLYRVEYDLPFGLVRRMDSNWLYSEISAVRQNQHQVMPLIQFYVLKQMIMIEPYEKALSKLWMAVDLVTNLQKKSTNSAGESTRNNGARNNNENRQVSSGDIEQINEMLDETDLSADHKQTIGEELSLINLKFSVAKKKIVGILFDEIDNKKRAIDGIKTRLMTHIKSQQALHVEIPELKIFDVYISFLNFDASEGVNILKEVITEKTNSEDPIYIDFAIEYLKKLAELRSQEFNAIVNRLDEAQQALEGDDADSYEKFRDVCLLVMESGSADQIMDALQSWYQNKDLSKDQMINVISTVRESLKDSLQGLVQYIQQI